MILDWYGCATFRMRSAGLNIFLDGYIDRASNAAGTGLSADDIDACDFIVFDPPDGRLLYQDTSGHWSGIINSLRPDVAILAAAGRWNIDGEPIQGSLAQFVARQADLLRPRRLVLCHHDNWLPGFSIDIDIEPIREELSRVVPHVELIELGYLDATEILPVR